VNDLPRPDGVTIAAADADAWAERYFAAWRTNAPEDVEALFAEDIVYFYGPFRPPAVGREEVVRRWIEGGAHDDVTSRHEVVAVAGDTAVIHWAVSFGGHAMDGVLIVRFDADGRCREHREWYAESGAGTG
jgi:ketosteroid isomerase-like protein